MELKDTINLMQSDDYKERFAAEYLQTKIRYQKLHKMLVKWEAGTIGFEPKFKKHVLEEQAWTMGNYLKKLEIRAEIEGVDIDWYMQNERTVVNATTGELLVREGKVYEVVCSDEDTFVVAPREYKNGDYFATNFGEMEAYCNDPSISTLTYMEFEKYTPEVGS